MPKLPSLNALKCFEAAARLGSFSNAAEELHVTQSAVSHQIRQLEEWFGFALFDRRGRQTVATPKGEELARAMAEAFDIIAAACKRIAKSDAGPALTIGSLPSIATIWLIPRLATFFREHPEISVKLVYAMHGQAIDFDGFDIAIQWGKGEWQDARVTRFLGGATVPVCSASLLDKEGPFPTPQSLLDRPLLHDTDRIGWQNWMRAAGIKHAGPSPGPIFEDFNLLRSAALAGQGVALCPASLIVDDTAAGRLVKLFDTAIFDDFAYYLVEPEDAQHRNATAIAIFKDWLLKQAAS